MSKYKDAFNDIVDHGISVDYFNKEAEKPQDENTILIIQELVDKETQYNYEYRGHKVKLLGIFQKSDVLSPSPSIGGHNGGTVSYPVAIVEYEDGSMGEVFPAELKRSK